MTHVPDDSRPPIQLTFSAGQILRLCERAIKAGRSIVKIRELYPEERALTGLRRLWRSQTGLRACPFLAPMSPAEDPRGGKIPIYRRKDYAPWFAAEPEVQRPSNIPGTRQVCVPKIIRDSGGARSNDDIRTLASSLDDFEQVILQFRKWYEGRINPFKGLRVAVPNVSRASFETTSDFQFQNAMRQPSGHGVGRREFAIPNATGHPVWHSRCARGMNDPQSSSEEPASRRATPAKRRSTRKLVARTPPKIRAQ